MNLPARISSYLSCAYRILFFIFGFVLFSLSAQVVNAQVPASYAQPNVEAGVPQNQHTFVQSITIELFSTLICQLSGIDLLNPEKGCLTIDPLSQKIGYDTSQDRIGGLIGTSISMIGGMYQPPASGLYYGQTLATDFGIVKNTYAQSPTGFNQLEPVQKLWIAVRNISYIFMVLAFVFIGMGVMLRVKVDPRTVMTIQSQLPKIVVTLLLITFSYAIVGFLIDMMWVSTYFGINTLTSAGNTRVTDCAGVEESTLKDRAISNILNYPVAYMNDVFQISNCWVSHLELPYAPDSDRINQIASSGIASLSWSVGIAMGNVVNDSIIAVIAPDGTDCGLRNFSGCVEYAIGKLFQIIASILGILIALIAILVALIRLWWTLLKAYAYIIIYTVTGPLFILLGLLPNGSLGFNKWIRTIVANLAVFPASAILIISARLVLDLYGRADTGNLDPKQVFVAPLVGNPAIDVFGPLLAFGMLLLAPELLNTLRDALKSPGSKLGGAVSSGFGVGQAAVGAGVGAVWGRTTAMGNPHYGQGSGILRRKLLGTGDTATGFQQTMRTLTGSRGFNPAPYKPNEPGPLPGSGH